MHLFRCIIYKCISIKIRIKKEKYSIMKERMSNLELLRVLCMLSIVSLHFINQCEYFRCDTLFYSCTLSFMSCFGRIACTIFIMISAYFAVDSKFSVKKLLMLWLTVVMYAVPITLVVKYALHYPITGSEIVDVIFPVHNRPLWFASLYILLYIFFPVMNAAIHNCKKGMLEIFLVLYGIFLFAKPTIIAHDYSNYITNDYTAFVYVYIFTGYLKKYPIKLLENKRITGYAAVILYCLLSLAYGAALYVTFGNHDSSLVERLELYYAGFYTLPNFVIALCTFMFFKNINIKSSKIINTMGKTTFGIYVIHQTPAFWQCVWFDIANPGLIYGASNYLVAVVIAILATFIACMFVEYIRLITIVPLLNKSKLINNVCSKLDNICN